MRKLLLLAVGGLLLLAAPPSYADWDPGMPAKWVQLPDLDPTGIDINMQAKGQPMRAFVLQGRAPQIVLAVSNKTMSNYKTLADLKGKKT